MTAITSSDLAEMAARAPALAANNKIRVFDAMYLNEPDVTLDGESVSVEEAIEAAALSAAPFVSVDMDEFDLTDLLVQIDENFPEDSPTVAELRQLVRKADGKYRGENERLWLRWGAQGLTYEWSATADWRRQLAVDMAEATYEGQRQSVVQAKTRDSEIDALVALLMDSHEFRAAMPTKRIPTAQAQLAAQQNVEDQVTEPAASRASTTLARRVLEFEITLKPQLEELAEELRHTQEWRAAASIPKRHDAAITFLLGKAEGFRLSSSISDPLMRAAKELDEKLAIKRPFPKYD
ncbi:hypothetical protein ASG92_24055 [Arthrobacter sp. Soil736]|uniref:hypothetical protein n=1 Tax=Arthrobacter sp. Soil736 TaxID=1736395 RepID=UPI0006F7AF65|nr:hypothetical protein [Arthrobacter sp. Soil736]KRE56037.1 hypothetical protein ASG92_24055 [Arthrobacter sp. Soil736]